jgi:hypothetical protein
LKIIKDPTVQPFDYQPSAPKPTLQVFKKLDIKKYGC